MDYEWTLKAEIPTKLYRVLHPYTKTTYDPAHGIRASLKLNKDNYIPFTRTPSKDVTRFFRSIIAHRDQELIASPYISLFADLKEAESWALAAEEVFGSVHKGERDCVFICEVDLRKKEFKEVTNGVWKLSDIERFMEKAGVMGTAKENLKALKKGRMGEGNRGVLSEYLVLERIPGIACKLVASSGDVRRARGYMDANYGAAYAAGHPIDEYPLPDQFNIKLQIEKPTFIYWERCAHRSKEVCDCLGGFNPPKQPFPSSLLKRKKSKPKQIKGNPTGIQPKEGQPKRVRLEGVQTKDGNPNLLQVPSTTTRKVPKVTLTTKTAMTVKTPGAPIVTGGIHHAPLPAQMGLLRTQSTSQAPQVFQSSQVFQAPQQPPSAFQPQQFHPPIQIPALTLQVPTPP